MSDRFGLLQLPAAAPPGNPSSTAVGDPLLDVLLEYLQAAINADTKRLWAAVHPAVIPPASEPLPVLKVFPHNPDEGSFSTKLLPALFAWRQGIPRNFQLTQEWQEQDSVIGLLWVPPLARTEHSRIRQPFRNALAKALSRAIANEQHPAWIAPADTDPAAAYRGSFLLPRLRVAKIDLVDVKPFDLVTGPESKPEPYDAVIATIEVRELLVPVKDDFDEIADMRGTVSLGVGADALPVDGFQFVPSVLSVAPASGPVAGGTAITVVGQQLFDDPDVGELVVTIGGARCADVVLVDGDTITAKTPPGSAGARNIVITLPSGASSAPLVGGFTYV